MTLEDNLSHKNNAKLKLLKNEIVGQRLSPMEVAAAIEDFLDETGWTQLKLATNMNYDAKAVCAYMSLLKLPVDIQTLVHEGDVPFWTAVEAQRADEIKRNEIFAKWRSGIPVNKNEIREIKLKDRWETVFEGKDRAKGKKAIDEIKEGRKFKIKVLNG